MLEATEIGHEQLLLVTAPDGEPAADTVSLTDLWRFPIISPASGSLRQELVDRAVDRVGAPRPRPVLELGHPEAMKRAAIDGLGATLLFRSAVSAELQAGALREVGIADSSLGVPVYCVMRADKRLSPLQEALLDRIRGAFDQ